MNYENTNGDTLTVEQRGKGFRTVQTVAGTERVEAYAKEASHRSWGGVQRIITTYRFVKV